MTTETPTNVTPIEDLAMSRLLERVLTPARTRLKHQPSAEAVQRMRTLVLGETAKKGKLAA